MNNEEAIRELKEYVRYGDEEFDTPFDKAIRFAIKALSQEPCEDAVSRQAVKGQMIKYGFHAPDMTVTEFVEDLPSVNPTRAHGKWIEEKHGYRCNKCNRYYKGEWSIKNNAMMPHKYCPHCGAEMREVQNE